MPRQNYELTTETRKVLTNRAGDFAEELNKSDKYFYSILANTETDPFAKFLPLYAAASRLGLSCYYRNKLEAIDARYAKGEAQELAECIREKISANTKVLDKFISAMSDGSLDLHEITALQPMVEAAMCAIEKLQVSLTFQRGMLEAESEKKNRIRRVA